MWIALQMVGGGNCQLKCCPSLLSIRSFLVTSLSLLFLPLNYSLSRPHYLSHWFLSIPLSLNPFVITSSSYDLYSFIPYLLSHSWIATLLLPYFSTCYHPLSSLGLLSPFLLFLHSLHLYSPPPHISPPQSSIKITISSQFFPPSYSSILSPSVSSLSLFVSSSNSLSNSFLPLYFQLSIHLSPPSISLNYPFPWSQSPFIPS